MNSFSHLEVIRILCKLIKSHPFGKSVWINDLIKPLLLNVVGVRTCYASARVASMCLWKIVQIYTQSMPMIQPSRTCLSWINSRGWSWNNISIKQALCLTLTQTSKILLVDRNVVPGPTTMLIREHVNHVKYKPGRRPAQIIIIKSKLRYG